MRQVILVLLIIIYNPIFICGYSRYEDTLTGDHTQQQHATASHHADKTNGNTPDQARNGDFHGDYQFNNNVQNAYYETRTNPLTDWLSSIKTSVSRWFFGEPTTVTRRLTSEPIIDQMTYHEGHTADQQFHQQSTSSTQSDPYVNTLTGPLTGWMLGASQTFGRLKHKYYQWLFGPSGQVAQRRQLGGAPFAGSGAGGILTGGLVSSVAIASGGLILHTAIQVTGDLIDANEQIILDLQAQVTNLAAQLTSVNNSAQACLNTPVVG